MVKRNNKVNDINAMIKRGKIMLTTSCIIGTVSFILFLALQAKNANSDSAIFFAAIFGVSLFCDIITLVMLVITVSVKKVDQSRKERKVEKMMQAAAANPTAITQDNIEEMIEHAAPKLEQADMATAEHDHIVTYQDVLTSDELQWRREQQGVSELEYELLRVDRMSGLEFEEWCSRLLTLNYFTNVTLTKASNDQGVDITAEKDSIKYAFQCKCYKSDLGNKPVQEINVGKQIYDCHIGVVITNSGFTRGAIEAAKATRTLLWNRDELKKLLAPIAIDDESISFLRKSLTNDYHFTV